MSYTGRSGTYYTKEEWRSRNRVLWEGVQLLGLCGQSTMSLYTGKEWSRETDLVRRRGTKRLCPVRSLERLRYGVFVVGSGPRNARDNTAGVGDKVGFDPRRVSVLYRRPSYTVVRRNKYRPTSLSTTEKGLVLCCKEGELNPVKFSTPETTTCLLTVVFIRYTLFSVP